MEDLKPIIAKNITVLRQNAKMTQFDLAEKLNYSDKAISKWERAESIPDVSVLKSIADLFGVTVDYLLQDGHTDIPKAVDDVSVLRHRNRMVITALVFGHILLCDPGYFGRADGAALATVFVCGAGFYGGVADLQFHLVQHTAQLFDYFPADVDGADLCGADSSGGRP